MSIEDLMLLQKANSLAEPINVSAYSKEGAVNLLSQPDKSDKVDLNNDGIVEIGAAKTIIFPLVNAPNGVTLAWGKATERIGEGDKMIIEMSIHMAIFGLNINGVMNKPAVDPVKQWGEAGIENLFNKLRGGLEFAVNMDGWSKHNLMLKSFYDNFEYTLNSTSAIEKNTILLKRH
jgi:hypothetical protein